MFTHMIKYSIQLLNNPVKQMKLAHALLLNSNVHKKYINTGHNCHKVNVAARYHFKAYSRTGSYVRKL